MDHSPPWLKPTIPSLPPWHNEPIEHEVDIRELTEYIETTHQKVIPRETYWTIPALNTLKEFLLSQIEEEMAKQEEINQLKEECANLAYGLEWLRCQRNKTIVFP